MVSLKEMLMKYVAVYLYIFTVDTVFQLYGWQAITRTNGGPVYWSIYASLIFSDFQLWDTKKK